MKKFWKDHSLSIVIGSILLIQTLIYLYLAYSVWSGEQEAHGQPINMGDFWNFFWAEMMVSTLADTYGAILLVVLTKRLTEKDSAESK